MLGSLGTFYCGVLGLYNNVEDSNATAESVPDTNGVYFIPAFSGLQVYLCAHSHVIMFDFFSFERR